MIGNYFSFPDISRSALPALSALASALTTFPLEHKLSCEACYFTFNVCIDEEQACLDLAVESGILAALLTRLVTIPTTDYVTPAMDVIKCFHSHAAGIDVIRRHLNRVIAVMVPVIPIALPRFATSSAKNTVHTHARTHTHTHTHIHTLSRLAPIYTYPLIMTSAGAGFEECGGGCHRGALHAQEAALYVCHILHGI